MIDTKAGLVVSPGSAEGIADAILRLKGDPALLRQMSLNARQCFEDRFTLARAYRQIEAVLKDMALAPETPHSQDRAVAINR